MVRKRINKRASIVDVASVSFVFFILFLISIISYIGYKELNDKLVIASQTANNQALNDSLTDVLTPYVTHYPSYQDFIVVFITYACLIAVIVGAYLLDNNPIFTTFYFIGGSILELIAILFTNSAWEFFNSPAILPYSASFPMSMWTLQYFPFVCFFWLLLVGVALYIKPQSNSGGFNF